MKEQDYTEEIKHIESLLVKLKDNHVGLSAKPIYLKQKIEFEVYHESLRTKYNFKERTKYNFKEAVDACKLLGEGWRLPTRVELLLMYENKDEIKDFTNNNYWSSTENDAIGAWKQDFTNGLQFPSNKGFNYYVRAVRNINH
tara:strand:+ start:1422 stop:1847 length:426 start_codon:yes stop_codon:yes gene_type:complete